jgi:hypothetical protein
MNLVVITGASRSGSTFFGDLLRRAPDTVARHEHIGGRDFFCASWYAPDHAFIRHEVERGFRELEAAGSGKSAVVDVNSNVAFAVDQLRAARPALRLFHLVRDGRKVVTSNWLRKMYTDYAKGIDIVPAKEAELDAWAGWDRFQKLCWQWNAIASGLLDRGVPVIRMERAVRDYDYLREALLEPVGLDLPRAVWEQRKGTEVNRSRFKIGSLLRGRPTELEWTPAREAVFQELCGATMRRLGYVD